MGSALIHAAAPLSEDPLFSCISPSGPPPEKPDDVNDGLQGPAYIIRLFFYLPAGFKSSDAPEGLFMIH